MDDLIGLLNVSAPVTTSCRPRSTVKEDLEREQRLRDEQQAKLQREQEADRIRKKAKLDEKRVMEDEDKRRAAIEGEAQRRRQEQERALEALMRLQQRRDSAAVLIQRYVRGLLARRASARMRIDQQQQTAAAIMLQAAARARAAREQLHGLRVEAFRRRCAARRIATNYIWYRSQWRLNPVQGPVRGGPMGSSALDGHAHLLAKPLRLRSMADARLAPETTTGMADTFEGDAARLAAAGSSGKRTVASARGRAEQMKQEQSRQRDVMGARALMAVSEHRDFQGAMDVVKTSGAMHGTKA